MHAYARISEITVTFGSLPSQTRMQRNHANVQPSHLEISGRVVMAGNIVRFAIGAVAPLGLMAWLILLH
jgi:hypothetical protein